MFLYTNCFRRAVILALAFALVLSGGIYAAQGDQAHIEEMLTRYFQVRYQSIGALEMDEAFEDFFLVDAASEALFLGEMDRVEALISYRSALNNNLQFTAPAKVSLHFLAAQIQADRAQIALDETFEYFFQSTPTVPNRNTVTHLVTLRKAEGTWYIVDDSYNDPSGFNAMLDDIYADPDMSKEEAINALVARTQAADDSWFMRFAEVMDPYPNVMVFMADQTYAWMDGRVQLLDADIVCTPVLMNGELLVPLRPVVEKVGGLVEWNASTNRIEARFESQLLSFTNQENHVVLNGEERILKQPMPIILNRTMVPLSLVAELLNHSAYIDQAGLAMISSDPMSLAAQTELHKALTQLFLARFSMATFPRVDGSTATYPYTLALGQLLLGLDETAAQGYLVHQTTHNAYENLLIGAADIILVTPPSDDELQMAVQAGVELEIVPICKEGFVFLVNDSNPVQSLTDEEVVGIYQGNIVNWSEVGGEDLPLIAYQREPNSGSQTMMELAVMKGRSLMPAPSSQIVFGMGALIDSVAEYSNAKGALGYSMFYYVSSMYVDRAVRMMGIDGVVPSRATIQDESYPYTVRYYAVLRKEEASNSPARRLLAWILSEEGQHVADNAGFVPL